MNSFDSADTPNLNQGRIDYLVTQSRIPIERFQFYAKSDPTLITEIRRGVLFVMAFWSVYAVKAFRELTAVIKRLDQDSALQVVVIETDGADSFDQLPELSHGFRGCGETAWIKDGKIQFTAAYHDMSRFTEHTVALLAMK